MYAVQQESEKAAVDEIKELLSSDNVESARDKIDYLVFTVKIKLKEYM